MAKSGIKKWRERPKLHGALAFTAPLATSVFQQINHTETVHCRARSHATQAARRFAFHCSARNSAAVVHIDARGCRRCPGVCNCLVWLAGLLLGLLLPGVCNCLDWLAGLLRGEDPSKPNAAKPSVPADVLAVIHESFNDWSDAFLRSNKLRVLRDFCGVSIWILRGDPMRCC